MDGAGIAFSRTAALNCKVEKVSSPVARLASWCASAKSSAFDEKPVAPRAPLPHIRIASPTQMDIRLRAPRCLRRALVARLIAPLLLPVPLGAQYSEPLIPGHREGETQEA